MKLIEVYDHLSDGELSQVNLGNGDRDINPRNYPRIGKAVALGLDTIFRRFFLEDGRVSVLLDPSIQTYVLSTDFASSNASSQEAVKYIQDSAGDPFEDRVLQIEAIYDTTKPDVSPAKLPLNVIENPDSLRTINYRTFVIPEAVTEAGLTRRVIYRKGHRKLTERDWSDPERAEISLPPTYMQALLYFVASRLHMPLGTDGNGANEGNMWMQRYELEARRLESQGLEIVKEWDSGKFRARGFV